MFQYYTVFVFDIRYTNCGWRYNCQNSYVTVSAYSNYAQHAENNFDNVAVFSKGHGTGWGSPPDYWHKQLLDHSGTGVKDSLAIYPYTTQGKHHFVFLWHYGTAMSYPSVSDGYGYIGMPYCWTHNNIMTLTGYASSVSVTFS